MEKLILKDRTIWIGDSEVAFGDTIEDAEPILEDKTLAKGETFIRLGKYVFFERPFQVTVSFQLGRLNELILTPSYDEFFDSRGWKDRSRKHAFREMFPMVVYFLEKEYGYPAREYVSLDHKTEIKSLEYDTKYFVINVINDPNKYAFRIEIKGV